MINVWLFVQNVRDVEPAEASFVTWTNNIYSAEVATSLNVVWLI